MANDDTYPKSALQCIENCDPYRFVCNFGQILLDYNLLRESDWVPCTKSSRP